MRPLIQPKSAAVTKANSLSFRIYRDALVFSLPALWISGCSGCLASPSNQTETKSPQPGQDEVDNATAPKTAVNESEATVQRVSPMESSKLVSKKSDKGSESAAPEDSTDSKDSNSPTPSAPMESPRKGKLPGDADSTLRTVEALRGKAQHAANRKQFGSAFRLTSQAWEAAQSHPKDVRLQKIAAELAIELNTLGKQANDQAGSKAADSSIRLIDK